MTRIEIEKAVAEGVDLVGADLSCGNLTAACLRFGILRSANLACTYLDRADLRGADFLGSYLGGASLVDSDLTDATMPDGRKWEDYRADPLAGVCDDPEARQRAIDAWGYHSWTSCPMNAALGIQSVDEAPVDKRILVACFVALFDSDLLPKPC